MLGGGGEGGEGELESFEGLEDERLNGGRLIYLEVEAKSPALEMGVNGVVLALGEGLDECKLGDTGSLIHLFINILRQIIKSIKLKMDKGVRIKSRVEGETPLVCRYIIETPLLPRGLTRKEGGGCWGGLVDGQGFISSSTRIG